MCMWPSLVALIVKNLPAMQETQVQSLGREDPLEKGMAIYSSILAWRIPWTKEPGGYSSWGCRLGHEWVTNTFFHLIPWVSTRGLHNSSQTHFIGKNKGGPRGQRKHTSKETSSEHLARGQPGSWPQTPLKSWVGSPAPKTVRVYQSLSLVSLK